MYRTLLARAAVATLVMSASIWLACATIPDFVVGSGADSAPLDATVPDGEPSDASGGRDAAPDGYMYRFFVTSAGHLGTFGATGDAGDAGGAADGICQRAADGSSLGGSWKAFFSPSTTSTPQTRFQQVPGGWHQVLSTKAAGEPVLAALTDDGGRLSAAILTEKGDPSEAGVWTGGTIERAALTCDDWAGAGVGGTRGRAGSTGADWMKSPDEGICANQKLSLYCIEVP